MGLFEEQPWLLVPVILVVVGLYDAAKQLFLQHFRNQWIRSRKPGV